MQQEIKERIELINKGIVPAGYKKTPVGICPVEWGISEIRKFLKIMHGQSQHEVECKNGTYPILGTGGIIGNANSYLYDKPSILIGRKGTIDKPMFIDTPFWTIDTLFYSKIFDNVNIKYLFYIFKIINWLKYDDSTGVPSLSANTIENIKIIVSTNNLEQQKIAEILDCATRQVELQEQLVDKLKVQKKALMQKLLTPRPDWQKDKLEKLINEGLITLYRGKVISKEDIKNFPGNYPIYSSSVINNGEMGEYGKYMFDEELITWSIDGGGNFFYRNKHKFSVTNVCGYIKINTNYFNYKFLAEELIYLHSKLSFDYMLKAHPSVIKKIYTINYPNLKEQTKIAKLALNLDKQIELQQKLLEQYKLRQKALMQLLLTGIVRVCK